MSTYPKEFASLEPARKANNEREKKIAKTFFICRNEARAQRLHLHTPRLRQSQKVWYYWTMHEKHDDKNFCVCRNVKTL